MDKISGRPEAAMEEADHVEFPGSAKPAKRWSAPKLERLEPGTQKFERAREALMRKARNAEDSSRP